MAIMGGCSLLSDRGAPFLTVENRDESEYRLAVSVVGVDDRGELSFRATTGSGDRTSVSAADLREPGGFRNVTLDADGARSQEKTVPAARQTGDARRTTFAINMWDPGEATVYVVETGEDGSLVGIHVVTCGLRDQDHAMTIEDGRIVDRSATCS